MSNQHLCTFRTFKIAKNTTNNWWPEHQIFTVVQRNLVTFTWKRVERKLVQFWPRLDFHQRCLQREGNTSLAVTPDDEWRVGHDDFSVKPVAISRQDEALQVRKIFTDEVKHGLVRTKATPAILLVSRDKSEALQRELLVGHHEGVDRIQ